MIGRDGGPVVLGEASTRLAALAGERVTRTAVGAALAPSMPTDGHVLLGTDRALGRAPASYLGVPDGNRSVVVPSVSVELGGRDYALAIKGVGALASLYGDSPLDFALASDFDVVAPEASAAVGSPRVVTDEAWMGEAPYGAQGEAGAAQALEVSALADGASIHGFYVCPTIAIVGIPDELVDRERFWYRRYGGRAVQEHRLFPSNVRLYHSSTHALGQAPREVLDAFGVTDREALDAFVDRYLASGTAALTLWARTVREGPTGPEGLDFDDVWLDKDSVVAPDGTLHFADLEALEWTAARDPTAAAKRIRHQVDRNYYELLYGLDSVLKAAEERAGRRPTPRERRGALVERWVMALAGDPFVELRRTDAGLELVVLPHGALRDAVNVRLLDTR